MKKKMIALFLAGIMSLSALTGCGSSNDNNQPNEEQGSNSQSPADSGESQDSKENDSESQEASGGSITFPIAEAADFTCFTVLNSGEYKLEDSVAMQAALENTNISITFDSVLGADVLEKRNLILASGEYPDMFFKAGLDMNELSKYGGQGIFIPLEDLIRQHAPNLTAILDERDGWQYIASSDGHIYSLPNISRPSSNMVTYWINKKWMDNLGLKEPANFDELYDVLKAFKEQDANGNGDPDDEIPFTANSQITTEFILAYADYTYDKDTKTAVIDGELTYIPTNDRFKEYISYVAKLYQEGILDKNTFTQLHEQQGAIGQANDVFGSFFDAGAFLTVGRDNDEDYIALTPFQKGTYPLNSGINPGAMAITDACEHPEVLVAWADRFYSEEGGIIAWMGVEGKTYEVNESGGWNWITGEGYGDDVATVRASNTMQGTQNHPSIEPDFWYQMSAEIDPDEVYLWGERAKIFADGAKPLPMMNYTDAESKELATLKTDIDPYIEQYVAQVSIGELDLEDSWDEYVETMKAMGAERLAEIYKNVYEAAGK